jgi:hypothetical protein
MRMSNLTSYTANEAMYVWIHLTYDLNILLNDRNLKWAQHTTGHLQFVHTSLYSPQAKMGSQKVTRKKKTIYSAR